MIAVPRGFSAISAAAQIAFSDAWYAVFDD